ncbi:hypothetical protein GLOIN_2v1673015 [Rhizophagus clarus]|uniref:Uncharacterized protein n=1 Tax=Rhizophagus clarus TaxID=94130 RepID=A0A8H3LD11_9GLOM|nr:hypothetical protein GLOIN_2v1673015 [Rhizophagus clarus]
MDKKMDKVNFVTASSIFDNLELHARPMDSSTKNAMDARRDLEVHRKNGGEEQKGMESIQRNSSSVQKKKTYFQQSRYTSKTNNIEGDWGHDLHSNPIRCSLLPVHDQFKLSEENSKEKNNEKNNQRSHGILESSEITFSTPRPNLSMDNYDGTKSQKTTKNNQHLPEIRPGKDYQPCIWCINYSLQSGRQGRVMYTPASERPLSSSSGSVWKCDSESRAMGYHYKKEK